MVLGDIINSTDKEINFMQKPCFIADVNNANGADKKLIRQLFNQKLNNFYGYCGYNTSANTLGCAILSAIVKYLSLKNNSYNDFAFKKLQFVRFLDDWAYQAISRKYIRESAPEFKKALDEKTAEKYVIYDEDYKGIIDIEKTIQNINKIFNTDMEIIESWSTIDFHRNFCDEEQLE